jgi:hypothetical protein
MNENEQNSLDDALNTHYQKRKQQHKMPASVAKAIHDYAQQVTAEHAQQTTRFLLLRPPIWASTFAACFVIVISIYLMSLEPDFKTDADYSLAAPSAAITASKAKLEEAEVQAFDEFSSGIKTEPKGHLKKMPTHNIERAAQTAAQISGQAVAIKQEARLEVVKPQFYQAPKPLETLSSPAGETSYGAQLASASKAKQQAGKQKQESFNYADVNMADDVKTIAVSGARISRTANRIDNTPEKAALQTVVQIQALEGKQNDQQATQRKAIDCDGQTQLVDIKHLKNIKHNDWVILYFDNSGELVGVEKLKQKPNNCNDLTNNK